MFINKLKKKLMVLKRREPKKAGQKPVMTKPLTILETVKKRKPLMKKVNTPSVNIFIGKVINIINGRKNALMIPKTKATTTAVIGLATSIPLTI